MALRGTLQDFSLADIFQLIGIQKKTGVLTLKSDKETCTVSFAEGQVVGTDSTARRLEDRLGSVLVKTGRITESQLQEALRVQRSTLRQLGHVLVESRFLQKEDLSSALKLQIDQMLYRLFRWTAGEYNFSQEEKVEYDRDLVVPMSAESILMEGARILDEWPMVEKGIHSFSTVFRHAEVEIAKSGAAAARDAREEAAGAVTLSPTEQQVYNLVDGRRTVQDVVDRSMLSEFETCRTLYELINRQILEEVRMAAPARGPAPAAPRKRSAATPPLLAGVMTLLLVLLTGGAILFRALPWLGQLRIETSPARWLSPFLSPTEARSVSRSIAESRLHAIDFAIQTYYLLNRGYPKNLNDLVTEGLLRLESLQLPAGQSIQYMSGPTGYQLKIIE
jgi:hypothetical protein